MPTERYRSDPAVKDDRPRDFGAVVIGHAPGARFKRVVRSS
jgi:hypothetical protein